MTRKTDMDAINTQNTFTDAEFLTEFRVVTEKNGLSELVAGKEASFLSLARMMLEFNSHTNITAITDLPGLILSHFCDSLTVAGMLPRGAAVADIGCGGGFPTLPLAIARPDISVTAIDSTAKKLAFVWDAVLGLELCNVLPQCMRAEDGAHSAVYREKFDVVTARAVSALPVLAELCLPYLKTSGLFCAMKGPRGAEELAEARNAVKTLGGTVLETKKVVLEGADGQAPLERMLIIIKKSSPTPDKYPRAYGKIKNKPL